MDRVGEVLLQTYRIERLLGEGGMSQVYEARHVRVPKRFAVKFLHVLLKNNSEALQRFRREAEVIAALEHPNVVGLIDYNVADDGAPFIVLELVNGQSLGARLDHGALPLFEAFRIAVAVGSALTAAHEQQIIHRDLKPENILLGKDEQIKVVDFGVAKLGGAPELTTANEILGTIAYMSPEQLTGKPVDTRTDQYALAAIVYEMLSGKMPFSLEGSVTEQAMRVLHAEPAPLEGVSPAIGAVLKRGMAKDSEQRFSSVGTFIDALLSGAHDAAPGELSPLPGEATSVSAPIHLLPLTPTDKTLTPPSSPAKPVSSPAAPSPSVPLPLPGSPTIELQAVEFSPAVGRDTDPNGTKPLDRPQAISERVTAPSMNAVVPETAEVELPRRTLGPGETTLRPHRRFAILIAAAALALIGVAVTAIALAR